MSNRHWTNSLSRLFGKFADTTFPQPMQRLINTLYVFFLKVDLRDFADAGSYKTLNALFTRKFVNDKHVDECADHVISPVDSLITGQGKLNSDILLQIKGREYSLKELLTEHAEYCDRMFNGDFVTFYLSPSDYHRYHAPAAFYVKKLIHVPGKLYPVNAPSARKRKNLFVQNERVILECAHEAGNFFYLIFVAALNVGKMVFEFEPRVETNTTITSVQVYTYGNMPIRQGECLGYFKMGSTVVMVSQKGFLELRTTVNQKVKCGDIVAQVKTGTSM